MEVGDKADDGLYPSLSAVRAMVDLLPNGILVGEVFPSEGLIDDRNMRRVGVVVFCEIPSLQNRNLKQTEIARCNAHPLASAAVLFDRTTNDVEPARGVFDVHGPPKARSGNLHA